MREGELYDRDLPRCAANHVPLSPVTFLDRSAAVWPERTALVYGRRRTSWRALRHRCRALASALRGRGIGRGGTVAALAANTPELFELHFAVPLSGGVLAALNTRLDAATIAWMLEHCEAQILFVDREFAAIAADAVARLGRGIAVIDIDDPACLHRRAAIGECDYEALVAEGDASEALPPLEDEWDAIALNYTSGTTGEPKGVVYHHRGAYLNAVSNALDWQLTRDCVYLWTLPMFHCNGWCFAWTIAAVGGMAVCLRQVRTHAIVEAIAREGVTHLCGAPTVLTMIDAAGPEVLASLKTGVSVMVAAAPPPPSVIEAIERHGWTVTHVYGLTESYGPVMINEWQAEWNGRDAEARTALKARQGVRGHMLEDVMVADPRTLRPVPADGSSVGELFLRGNNVMKGYLRQAEATEAAFRGGWLHTGDLAVRHPDGYVEIRDRAKDIIISGGENIATIEIENALHRHPSVQGAAVVARPDPLWGETPCAFVELRPGESADANALIAYCRTVLARFKVPRHVIFGPLPRSSTGKVLKYVLRETAREDAEGRSGLGPADSDGETAFDDKHDLAEIRHPPIARQF